MNKHFLFLLLTLVFISCKKDCPDQQPEGEEQITGTLTYHCVCLDGGGLFYQTDQNKTLVFKYDSTDSSTFEEALRKKYEAFLDIHTRLTYISTGKTRCASGMTNGCILVPIVEIVKFEKQ